MLYSAVVNQVQIHSQSSTGLKSKIDMLDRATRYDLK